MKKPCSNLTVDRLALAVALSLVVAFLVLGCQSYVPREQLAEEYHNLGNAYYELERYEEAARYYRRALGLNSELTRTDYNLARALIAAEDYPEAIGILETLRAQDPENVTVTETLAYALSQTGDAERAESLYSEVLEASPYRVSALLNSALLLKRQDELERAAALLRRAHDAAPEDPDVLFQLGTTLFAVDEPDRGVALLETYLESEPEDVARQRSVASTFEEHRYFDRALEAYDRVLEEREQDPEASFGKARILLTAAEDPEAGASALQAAVDAGFSDAEAMTALLEREDLRARERVRSIARDAGLISEEPQSESQSGGDEEVDNGGTEGEASDAESPSGSGESGS